MHSGLLCYPTKKWASNLDNHTHNRLSKSPFICQIQRVHGIQYISYYAWRSDGLGIPCIAISDDLQIAWTPQAFKFLYSRAMCIHVKSVAVELVTVKARSSCSSSTPEDTLQFLNVQRETHTNYSWHWITILPSSLELLGAHFQEGDDNLELKIEDVIIMAYPRIWVRSWTGDLREFRARLAKTYLIYFCSMKAFK